VNNRGKTNALFPKSPLILRRDIKALFSAEGAARMMGVIERSVINFIASLPVLDVAFVLLVIVYVKTS
jgi:hypothetical protein